MYSQFMMHGQKNIKLSHYIFNITTVVSNLDLELLLLIPIF